MARYICSMYWDNIEPSVPLNQKKVLDHLGFQIRQDRATGVQHGDWMDQILRELDPDDTVLFLDVDCIPLSSQAVIRAFEAAEAGRIHGVAQTANHKPNSQLIYAAPCFLCFTAQTWLDLGRPSMTRSTDLDVGMALTQAAQRNGRTIDLLFPSFVCCPKWPLANMGAVGFATFYNGDVFHLFQSRHNKAYEFSFHYVADCITHRRPLDYIYLFNKMNSSRTFMEDSIRSFPRNMRRYLSDFKKLLALAMDRSKPAHLA